MSHTPLTLPLLALLDDYTGSQWTCTDAEVRFTNLQVEIENTSGCNFKPILKADSITHSLATDSEVTIHVNCTMVGAASPMGGVSCAGGGNFSNNDLQHGINFTIADVLAGIDLNSLDSTNAAEVTRTATSASAWLIRVISFNNVGCGTQAFICIDYGNGLGDGILNFTGYVLPDNGNWLWGSTNLPSSMYWPQFETSTAGTAAVVTGTGSYLFDIELTANVDHYDNLASSGTDSFGSGEYKIEIQYNDNVGGGWIDAIDNDSALSAGTGGAGGQTFRVTEADCWNSPTISVQYRIVAQGDCGGGTTNGAWCQPTAGAVDIVAAGADCGGGGGGAYTYEIDPCDGTPNILADDPLGLVSPAGTSINMIVSYIDGAGGTYCGTLVAFQNYQGTTTHSIDSIGFIDCADCNTSIGGGGGGTYYEVQDCTTGTQYIADDTMGMLSPSVGDIILCHDKTTLQGHCVEVLGVSVGPASLDTSASGYIDCTDCNNSLGGGP